MLAVAFSVAVLVLAAGGLVLAHYLARAKFKTPPGEPAPADADRAQRIVWCLGLGQPWETRPGIRWIRATVPEPDGAMGYKAGGQVIAGQAHGDVYLDVGVWDGCALHETALAHEHVHLTMGIAHTAEFFAKVDEINARLRAAGL